MGQETVAGAQISCSFGTAPGALLVIPKGPPVMAGGPPAATIMDNIPIANIPPFAMCTTPSNPQVAAATAAALGVLTPMPCIPIVAAPWAPGSPTVMINNFPALTNSSKCFCSWGGVIQIGNAGQATVNVP